jgi:hypothetical protein
MKELTRGIMSLSVAGVDMVWNPFSPRMNRDRHGVGFRSLREIVREEALPPTGASSAVSKPIKDPYLRVMIWLGWLSVRSTSPPKA